MGGELKVLFVEDEEADAQLASHELRRAGIEFTSRRVATEAVLRYTLTQWIPDVVICDYCLPGFSGAAAIEVVQQLCPQTPVLFVTGSISEEAAIEFLHLGVTDYILKSNLRRLAPALRRAVDEAHRRAAMEGRIERLAHYDTVTGLPNLAYVHELAQEAIAHAAAARGMMALVVLNIDRFRVVDGGFGRAFSDEALREVSAALRMVSRDQDTVARVGSDEFLVILSAVDDATHADALIQRLLSAVAFRRTVQGQELRLTASAGVALFPADGQDFETLVGNAGAALRVAKDTRCGRAHFHSASVVLHAKERFQLESNLREAFYNNTLTMHFQPQFELETGRASGAEALTRWFRPDGQAVPPSTFIPLAEECGLVEALGLWALNRACATAAAWRWRAEPAPTVSVNVSTRQIGAGFSDALARVLETSGLPPERLELEITESLLIGDEEAAVKCLRSWKRLGLRIAIDDFGIGYSNLSYLSRLPVDRLKIDQSLIRDMITSTKDAAIVRTVIALGKDLGVTVIAEGVETEEQLWRLRELGCDQAQGYLLAPPLAAMEARVAMARKWGLRTPIDRIHTARHERCSSLS